MQKIGSFTAIIIFILVATLSIRLAEPPTLQKGPIPDTSFSVARSYGQLQKIASAPHMIGSAIHDTVRSYIFQQCKQLGFDTHIQEATVLRENWDGLTIARVQNIVAFKKGAANSKSVVLMAHYDSEPNTQGAGDDGGGVAAILEAARALNTSRPLKNDLVLLITDAEEIGLFGAAGFLNESPLANNIGIVLNFEGRGNSGPSNMFEVNEQNGWAVGEYIKAVPHPFANSLGYEIYKKLPNSTDYTIFKNAGITGLNNAHIDGHMNYHSPTDKPENYDLRTLRHHGENMLALVKHFGNLEITTTRGPDISYFNAIGNWFIHYPASWNFFFVLLVNMLFVIYIIMAFKTKEVNLLPFIASVLIFLITLAAVYFAAQFVRNQVISAYPLYTHFFDNESYNNKWYFLGLTALAVLIVCSIYYMSVRRISMANLYAGILLLLVVGLNTMQFAVPSGSYLLFIPLGFILTGQLMRLRKRANNDASEGHMTFLLSVMPALFILTPVLYAVFLAFGLGINMPFVLLGVGLLTGLLLPAYINYPNKSRPWLAIIASVVFVFSMATAHLKSGYTKEQPLQTNIRYELDADSSKARWVSEFTTLDSWTEQFFKNAVTENRPWGARLVNEAPVIAINMPQVTLFKDSIINGKRIVLLHIQSDRPGVTSFDVKLDKAAAVSNITVNGKENRIVKDGKPAFHTAFSLYGFNTTGADILFELPSGNKLSMTVTDKSIGLPPIQGYNTIYPPDVIPGVMYGSNSLQVTKRFVF